MKKSILIKYIHLKTTGSTNDYGKIIAKTSPQKPLVIISNIQTKGKGRFSNTWYSNDQGGLYYTFLSPVSHQIIIQKNLSYKIGKIISSTINKTFHIKTSIEWPNDIIFYNKKLGGILIETTSSFQKKYIIIGIGLNLNQKIFPTHLKPIAISLYQKTKKTYDKYIIIKQITINLYKFINQIKIAL